MDKYVTGAAIRRLRDARRMTQEELAGRLFVSAKTVSKWETGHGLPDISLLEPLAAALGISVIELLSGEDVRNVNRGANMLRSVFYVCPVCGNVITASGEAVISCCGITLPRLEAEETDEEHNICVQYDEDEVYISLDHPMTKAHHLTFLAAVSDMGVQIARLYPEGAAEARFKCSRVKWIYAYCRHHGLYRVRI